MKNIYSDKAPNPVGPYSQAIETNGFIFCSGQIGLDPTTSTLKEGIEAQAEQVIKNLENVLKADGSDLSKVVKTTIFLKNMDDYAKVNEIYAKFFSQNNPARATVEVSNLPGETALIEIEAIAIK